MADPEVEKRFAWGSDRVQAWAAERFAFDAERRGDIDRLKQLWTEQRRPEFPAEWPSLFEFQRRFGGLTQSPKQTDDIGIAWWLGDPSWFRRGVYRANRRMKTWDQERQAPVRHDVRGRWLGMIRFYDLDFADFVDEKGRIFHIAQLSSQAYPVARDAEHYFEKQALLSEVGRARPVPTGDCFIEVDGWVGEEVAREASIPLVAEASDDMTRHYWDGTVAVDESALFGDPRKRGTSIRSGDFDRVSAIAKMAWPHTRGRDRAIRVIGWPNAETYGLCRRLAADHPKMSFVVRTTYP